MVSIYVQPTSLAIDKYPTPDKERAQLLWVAHMNGLKAQAEEVVVREIMYAERNHASSCLSIQTWYNGTKERDTMSPIEVPAKIQLVEKRETRTSRGMLSKGWYRVDDQLVMVKGNSITEAGTAGYEPYSEVMASLIAQVLGLPDYNAWEIVKRTNACLMEDPYWLRFSEDETFEDTTRGRAKKIMDETQKNS